MSFESNKHNSLRQRARPLHADNGVFSVQHHDNEPEPPSSSNQTMANLTSGPSQETLNTIASDDAWLYMLLGSLILLIGVSVAIVIFVKNRHMRAEPTCAAESERSTKSVSGQIRNGNYSTSSSGYVDISNRSGVGSSPSSVAGI